MRAPKQIISIDHSSIRFRVQTDIGHPPAWRMIVMFRCCRVSGERNGIFFGMILPAEVSLRFLAAAPSVYA